MEKKKKTYLIIMILIIFLLTFASFTYFLFPPEGGIVTQEQKEPSSVRSNGSKGGNVTETPFSIVVLGSNQLGRVIREGPYGNTSSPIKIAYIVGVHPLESNSHRAILESIKSNENNLKYAYYVYRVLVTQDANDYDQGRMNGQLLAREYVVTDIVNRDYKLAIDVHSNRGNYEELRFIFAPVEGGQAEKIAHSLINKIPWMHYYKPPSQTSPAYVTIPINNGGVPAVIYETYQYESYSITRSHANDFVRQVDNLIF